MTNKFSNTLKQYLHKTHIIPQAPVAQYKKELGTDTAVAFLYTFISAILIWIQEADVIIMGLNILCLSRCGISNLIKSSQMAIINIDERRTLNRYHIKAAITFTCVIFCALLWGNLLECKPDEVGLMIKIFAIIIIAIVFLNDCDDSIVLTYDGTVG